MDRSRIPCRRGGMMRMAAPSEIEGRWTDDVVLKRDLLSTVERGRFITPAGEVAAVLRRIDDVPWWSFALARHLFARERSALGVAGKLGVAPSLLFGGRSALVRSWIDGLPLHLAKPHGDHGYFRSAKAALRSLHRAGICHNDLAKEQNWLRGTDGCAYLTDFQLAAHFSRRTWLFRIAAYEDLRHLLKHKQRYAPEAVTAAERRVLARKSLLTRIWMATGKKVYYAITRGVFRFTDREGGGPRLVYDAPLITARLKTHPQVRETVVLAFPDRRAGTGLYAFVEAAPGLSERSLREFIAIAATPKPPEHLQVIEELPRRASGEVRSEILQLVAMNQVDQIEALVGDERERTVIARIVADRRNLRDRFSF
jgi:predicted Ser/Thr protein kinase